MTHLETISHFAAIPKDMNPLGAGFEAGGLYEQVDLGSRATVCGLARVLREDDLDAGFHALEAAGFIQNANMQSPGKYVVFAGEDLCGEEITYVYQRVA